MNSNFNSTKARLQIVFYLIFGHDSAFQTNLAFYLSIWVDWQYSTWTRLVPGISSLAVQVEVS